MEKRAEQPKKPLYRELESITVAGYDVSEVKGLFVSSPVAPFAKGFISELSHATTAFSQEEALLPDRVQISRHHKRSSELRFGKSPYIFWADEYKNIFGTLRDKGLNVMNPGTRVERRAPSGFLVWGIQDSSSIERTLAASNVLRSNNIDTEVVIKITEPAQIPYKGVMLSRDEFKKQLVRDTWDTNYIGDKKKEEEMSVIGEWVSPTRADVPRLAQALNEMTFYETTLAQQVSERLADLGEIKSDEELKQMMEKVFVFVNKRIKVEKDNCEEFDASNPQDIFRYFTSYLPDRIASNYAKLHNLGLVHIFPHLGNVSLAGGIYDIDSVTGKGLDLGDDEVSRYQIEHDIAVLIKGDGAYLCDGIISLFNEIFPQQEGEEFVPMLFLNKFLETYIEKRDLLNEANPNLDHAIGVLKSAGVSRVKEYLLHMMGDNEELIKQLDLYWKKATLYSNYPIVVENERLQSAEKAIEIIPVNIEEKSYMLVLRQQIDFELFLHDVSDQMPKMTTGNYFEFSEVDQDKFIKQLDSRYITNFVHAWRDGDLEKTADHFNPRIVGSFLLLLSQSHTQEVRSSIHALFPDENDPEFVQKCRRLSEIERLLPADMGQRMFKEHIEGLNWPKNKRREFFDDLDLWSSIQNFSRGIIDLSTKTVFNHRRVDIVTNYFTKKHMNALQAAKLKPNLVDRFATKSSLQLIRFGIANIEISDENWSEVDVPDGFEHALTADIPQKKVLNSALRKRLTQGVNQDQLPEILFLHLSTGKELNSQSYLADVVKKSELPSEKAIDLLNDCLEVYEGKLEEVNPLFLDLLSRTKPTKVSSSVASELVQLCIAYQIDIPKVIENVVKARQNVPSFQNFLTATKTYRRVVGNLAKFGVEQIERDPLMEFFTKGLSILPPSIQEILTDFQMSKNTANAFNKNIVEHLFNHFYLNILSNERFDEEGDTRLWKYVHQDIWSILSSMDQKVLRNACRSYIQNGDSVKVRGKAYEEREVPLEDALPPHIVAIVKRPPIRV